MASVISKLTAGNASPVHWDGGSVWNIDKTTWGWAEGWLMPLCTWTRWSMAVSLICNWTQKLTVAGFFSSHSALWHRLGPWRDKTRSTSLQLLEIVTQLPGKKNSFPPWRWRTIKTRRNWKGSEPQPHRCCNCYQAYYKVFHLSGNDSYCQRQMFSSCRHNSGSIETFGYPRALSNNSTPILAPCPWTVLDKDNHIWTICVFPFIFDHHSIQHHTLVPLDLLRALTTLIWSLHYCLFMQGRGTRVIKMLTGNVRVFPPIFHRRTT